MSWIAELPNGVLYGVLALAGIMIVGILALAAITLVKGGKVKAGAVELDTEENEKDNN